MFEDQHFPTLCTVYDRFTGDYNVEQSKTLTLLINLKRTSSQRNCRVNGKTDLKGEKKETAKDFIFGHENF